MKTIFHPYLIAPFLVALVPSVYAQPAASDGAVVSRGPHHRTWERAEVHVLPNGRSITNRSSFVELETGLHLQNEQGEWVESSVEIELIEGAAIVRQGPYQAIWAANANTPGSVDLLTADDKRLRSHVIGLGVFDPATGNSELLAEIKDSIGELLQASATGPMEPSSVANVSRIEAKLTYVYVRLCRR